MIAASAASCPEIAQRVPLTSGWEMGCGPGELRFVPAQVPGTAAAALREQGMWRRGEGASLDSSEYVFRCRFDAEPAGRGEEVALEMGGIATLSEVRLNGRLILTSSSMFASHQVNVSTLLNRGGNELLIVCKPLSAALRARRGQAPPARWRTRVVSEPQLRWFRTPLLGRAPGFAADPAPVGPWRPVTLLRRQHVAIEHWSRHAELDGAAGAIHVSFQVRPLRIEARPVSAWLHSNGAGASVAFEQFAGGLLGRTVLRIPDVRRWWPHTHGEPALYPLRLEMELAGGTTVVHEDLPVGFRSLESGTEFGLSVNGERVFCRGVVWTPPDPIGWSSSPEVLESRLRLLRDGGFNLVRLPGTSAYECEAFHRLCDELGLLVWQDMMFANLDYPFADPGFWELACGEAADQLRRIGRHASTAVVCGNSEIEQQAGMLGLDASLGRGAFFGEELPRIAARFCRGVPYLPSAPCGGDQPFRTRAGVTNYFGVGAYLRPLEDARRAEVSFASECLAFSNVPEPEAIEKMASSVAGGISPVHPLWKRGVPRDAGAGWDFEDARDHYLQLLYSVDPAALRYSDVRRYWELSRMVTGEVMAEVFGEWRRPASPCGGGIVLWSADWEPGAGWGILDSSGCPKAAYWHLKRALTPCAVWTTDEGLNGVDVHVSNDRPEPLAAHLRVALYGRGEHKVAEAERPIDIGARQAVTFGLEQILGRFVDASYAYRFGPQGHDLIVASLHRGPTEPPFAQSFRFPAGRPTQRPPISELGIDGRARFREDGAIEVLLNSRRFAWGVRVTAPGATPGDCYFGIEPGGTRRIAMTLAGAAPEKLAVTAANGEGQVLLAVEKAV